VAPSEAGRFRSAVPPSGHGSAASPPDVDGLRQLLGALGDHVRDQVIGARGIDMAAVEGETSADTIFAIDKVADDTLVDWFEQHWSDVELVSEGLDDPVVVGADPQWTVIVDSIDGTRGLMYDKRPAWCLAAAAPRGGSLRDVVAAAMTELPTTKQGAADQLSAVRGGGLVAERIDLRGTGRARIAPQPSTAVDLEHGFATVSKFFPPGKAALVELEAELFRRLGSVHVFDDEYISSGGQLHELIVGHDRFVADLRPIVDPDAFACHPYDVCTAMLLEEAGGVVTDPRGAPLDVPLDTTTPVAWAGYANRALADRIGPILAELVDELPGR
jgi:fructose-1,6-bisphosphatase/inositol monophosphatase family enzyme